jgi:hypothetical protein
MDARVVGKRRAIIVLPDPVPTDHSELMENTAAASDLANDREGEIARRTDK